ncbi:hypothetical protein KH5H1_71930 [Corallococcus caeni]|nr:hypothetical protein KH5H1_71930 [Corallococcus sp. KH5-1]
MRLYLPEDWTADRRRMRAAGIPREVRFERKWELALELLDEARRWGVHEKLVLADSGYGSCRDFLAECHIKWAALARVMPMSLATSLSSLSSWRAPPSVRLSRRSLETGKPRRAVLALCRHARTHGGAPLLVRAAR